MSQGTYIDGIASSQAIDTAGEIVDIAGMDISSLVGSVFNYEHKSDVPAQIVGKILYAKKIFDEKDCENDRQSKCWASCKMPYLYVMGQLFDDYSPSAKEIAGIFMYDSDNQDKAPTLGFSIEGSKISKEGMIVNRSIARKVTITVQPANKTCLAEIVKPDQGAADDDLASIFKTEIAGPIDMLKGEQASEMLKGTSMHKAEPADPHADYKKGSVMGQTSTGKDVYSHGMIGAAGFSPEEHQEAGKMHFAAASQKSGDAKAAQHHYNKYKLHQGAFNTASAKKERITGVKGAAKAPAAEGVAGKSGQLFDPRLSGKMAPPKKMAKALEAGSGNVAPGQLSQGAALAKQSLKKAVKNKHEKGVHQPHDDSPSLKGTSPAGTMSRMAVASKTRNKNPEMAQRFSDRSKGVHKEKLSELKAMPKPKLTKSEMLQRAEQEYHAWTKRSEFEKFMADKMPKLAKGEIKAIGQTLALKKALDDEKELAALVNYEKPSVDAK